MTGMTPLQAMYGINLHYTINPNLDSKILMPAIMKEYADNLAKLHGYLCSEMVWAQGTYWEQANKYQTPSPMLEVKDKVWLTSRNLKTTRPLSKLDYNYLETFKVIKNISSHTYELELPTSIKILLFFYISLLESAATDPLPSQLQPLLPLSRTWRHELCHSPMGE